MDSRNPPHGPLEEAIADVSKKIGRNIAAALPEGWGFALMVFRMNAPGRMNYLSNAERSTMITALEELVANMKADARG